ncbi:MAG: DNA/RNA non-specific endonuclease [Paludibacteraceae bacterium]|nr:DNA/RNA non-specific endonuclease [Paludibacteraceae bacterium]
MAKNKRKNSRSSISAVIAAVVCLIGALSYILSAFRSRPAPDAPATAAVAVSSPASVQAAPIPGAPLELPQLIGSRPEQLIEHVGYAVSYNPDWHLPNWVAYELTASEADGEFTRTDKFLPDPMVEGDPVVTADYKNSGYDRGHMAPAADMRWSEQAMKESFYMTNMCPQNHNNNAGDWKDLEELVRDLANVYGSIYICCGPIVTDTSVTIGTLRKIVVPQAFYKVLLRQKADGSWTSIGFVMPNAAGNRPLMTYMLPVDSVEQRTGIDFFCNLPDSVEQTIETDFNVADWNTN